MRFRRLWTRCRYSWIGPGRAPPELRYAPTYEGVDERSTDNDPADDPANNRTNIWTRSGGDAGYSLIQLDSYYAGWKILTTFECVNAEEIRGTEGNAHRARIHTSVAVYYAGELINSSKWLSHRGRRAVVSYI